MEYLLILLAGAAVGKLLLRLRRHRRNDVVRSVDDFNSSMRTLSQQDSEDSRKEKAHL